MKLLNLNFTLDASWRGTLNKIFQQLRRVKFVVEDTFSFGSFESTTDANFTKDLDLSYYLAIGQLVFVRLYVRGTVSGAPTSITCSVPYMFYNADDQTDGQYWTGYLESGGGRELGFFIGASGATNISVLRTTAAGNWSNGASRFIISNFFYRRTV